MAATAAAARITPDALSVFRKSSVIRLAMASVSMAAPGPLRYPDGSARERRRRDEMRLTRPRFAPLSDAELTPEQAEALEPMRPGPVLNIFRTLAHAPKALARFNQWGGYVLSRRNDLAPREREIVILRTGFPSESGYQWTPHLHSAPPA